MSELDHVHELDPEAALDVTGDELVDAWRGVKAEEEEQVAGGLASLLRARSRKLLADLARPHRGALLVASVGWDRRWCSTPDAASSSISNACRSRSMSSTRPGA
jgi:hypothetical protein